MKRAREVKRLDNEQVKKQKVDETLRIVLNKCVGGFGLSDIACHALMERLGYSSYDTRVARQVLDTIERDHPVLLEVVQEFGTHAWTPSGENEWIHRPVIVEIPKTPYEIVWQHGYEIAIPINFEHPLGPF